MAKIEKFLEVLPNRQIPINIKKVFRIATRSPCIMVFSVGQRKHQADRISVTKMRILRRMSNKRWTYKIRNEDSIDNLMLESIEHKWDKIA